MKATTLIDVLNCLEGRGGEEIIMDGQLIAQSVKCIEKMIEYGG